MIRRHVGNEFWLITQHDHALISGQLAEHFGSGEYQRLGPRAIRGIALHDCGWPLHDDEAPTLNPRGEPLDVFESPPQVAARVWPESSRRAALEDPYAGLLVSLHVLSLSVYATTPSAIVHERFDLQQPAVRFEVNKFQQQQIELQETLRLRLGMRIDEPRRFGLAEQSSDPREKQLIFDFRLLQAMDRLSLSICCTQPPFESLDPLLTQPAGENRPIMLRRTSNFELSLSPWPFPSARVTAAVRFRRLVAEQFKSEHVFQSAYRAAAVEHFEFLLRQ